MKWISLPALISVSFQGILKKALVVFNNNK